MTETRAHPTVAHVTSVLRERGANGTVRWLDESVTTAAAAAAALGIETGAIANSLAFTLDGTPVLVMTSGAHRVDTAWLGEKLGGHLHRASPDVVRAATGQAIGGVAPVGHPAPLRTFVDEWLASYPEIWAAAGHANTVFPTTFDELVRITDGMVILVELLSD